MIAGSTFEHLASHEHEPSLSERCEIQVAILFPQQREGMADMPA